VLLLAGTVALFIAVRRDRPTSGRVASANVLTGSELDLDRFGWVNSLTGRGLMTGELMCSQPTRVRLDLVLVQRAGERKLERSTSRLLECDGAERLLISVRGPFAEGLVGFDATARFEGDEDVIMQRSNSVTLRSCTIIGTLGHDELSGTRGDDDICGMSGDDVLLGGDGDDELRGSDGEDILKGEDGKDLLTGSFDKDGLSGGRGTDRLYGDGGVDRLNGGSQHDHCSGGKGFDRLVSCEVEG
jgi:Ca2+-binding RTX toxin-like protein